jgi:hypothetical protein
MPIEKAPDNQKNQISEIRRDQKRVYQVIPCAQESEKISLSREIICNLIKKAAKETKITTLTIKASQINDIFGLPTDSVMAIFREELDNHAKQSKDYKPLFITLILDGQRNSFKTVTVDGQLKTNTNTDTPPRPLQLSPAKKKQVKIGMLTANEITKQPEYTLDLKDSKGTPEKIKPHLKHIIETTSQSQKFDSIELKVSEIQETFGLSFEESQKLIQEVLNEVTSGKPVTFTLIDDVKIDNMDLLSKRMSDLNKS